MYTEFKAHKFHILKDIHELHFLGYYKGFIEFIFTPFLRAATE